MCVCVCVYVCVCVCVCVCAELANVVLCLLWLQCISKIELISIFSPPLCRWLSEERWGGKEYIEGGLDVFYDREREREKKK